ncbi:hypothetical protein BV22DRAFT_1104217 [Leucogyrophana mollusca]|uniref:Uncharacterized protein n=1 Tax=Leucogyrophana mollusca TaxID=85980 RepID=A0ACB8BNZ0_9AGAM|nr:hypothetical protein BV22DRAFT_1104217 [Leucogyrophana mollusca]
MLVLSSSATCDVCLEGYSSGAHAPHSITCGHVFCQRCLDHLTRHTCPLCRTRFTPQDIRKLHVDRGQTPRVLASSVPDEEEDPEPPSSTSATDAEAKRLQDNITRVVREGAKETELRKVIDECRSWYKTQPADQYGSLRVSCLLLYHLTESQRKLAIETDKVREALKVCEELRNKMSTELEAAECKYQELLRTSQDEKETALAVEKSLREHYEQLDAYWKSQFDAAVQECKALREELKRARVAFNPLPQFQRPIEVRYFYAADSKFPASSMDDLKVAKKLEGLQGQEEDTFHLSPLPENIPPLPSALQSFSALAEDSDEDSSSKNIVEGVEEAPDRSNGELTMAYPLPQPRAADPIPIPDRPRVSRQTSCASVTMSDVAELWQSGLSSSRPREQDVVMSSRPPSPSSRYPSDRVSSNYDSRSKDQVVTRQVLSSDDQKERERWKAQLHDLLDSPMMSSSLHSNMSVSVRSDHFVEPHPPMVSRPSSSNARANPPSRPTSATHLPSSSVSSHVAAATTHRQGMTHASSAALQLEREKRERERERLRHAPSIPSSLKDTTNAQPDAQLHRHHSRSGKGKSKTANSPTGAAYAMGDFV